MNKKVYSFLSYKLILFLSIIYSNNYFISKVYSTELDSRPSVDYLKKSNKENFYILGPGDTLKLSVSEDAKELDSVFTINGEGYAYLKRLKKVYLSGLTINELKKILTKEYKKFVLEPDVELDILRYRPIKIYIDGEVETPGQHILKGSYSIQNNQIFDERNENLQDVYEATEDRSSIYFPTLVDIIRKSDGLTAEANLKEITITRRNNLTDGGGRLKTTVNLLKVLNLEDSSQNIRILDGDTIYIAKGGNPSAYEISKAIKSNLNPAEISIYVGGRVEFPGRKKISKSASLNDAIDISGGSKIFKGPVRLIRNNNNGETNKRKFKYRRGALKGSLNNPFLKNGDIIYIGKSKFNIATEVLNEVTSPLQSLVSIYGIYKVFD